MAVRKQDHVGFLMEYDDTMDEWDEGLFEVKYMNNHDRKGDFQWMPWETFGFQRHVLVYKGSKKIPSDGCEKVTRL